MIVDRLTQILSLQEISHRVLTLPETRRFAKHWRERFARVGRFLTSGGENFPMWEMIDAEEVDYLAEERYRNVRVQKYLIIPSDWHSQGAACDGPLLPKLDEMKELVYLIPGRAGVALCDEKYSWSFVVGLDHELFFTTSRQS